MTQHRDPTAERTLVEQCLAGDQKAWDRMVHDYMPSLVGSVRHLLRSRGNDANLAEEITHQVWIDLFEDDCRRLRAYDADRAALTTFLKVVAREVIQEWIRAEGHRPEVPLQEEERVEETMPMRAEDAIMLNDLQESLPRAQRAFVRDNLAPEGEETHLSTLSDENVRQLTTRVRHRLDRDYRRD